MRSIRVLRFVLGAPLLTGNVGTDTGVGVGVGAVAVK